MLYQQMSLMDYYQNPYLSLMIGVITDLQLMEEEPNCFIG